MTFVLVYFVIGLAVAYVSRRAMLGVVDDFYVTDFLLPLFAWPIFVAVFVAGMLDEVMRGRDEL